VRTDPALFTTSFAKRGRERKILVDYLRNNRTNTSVCAFSPRARKGAPVSLPVAWNELEVDPREWTLLTVPARLARMRRDPWAGYFTAAQRMTRKVIDALRTA
jgi:bifunctional non-homologous end joining protein LigD